MGLSEQGAGAHHLTKRLRKGLGRVTGMKQVSEARA